MAFTYAPDFIFGKKRRGFRDGTECDVESASFAAAVPDRHETDNPGWTVLNDGSDASDATARQNDRAPPEQQPPHFEPAPDAASSTRALTVDDFLRWSVRTPLAKRYGGRKQRRMKLQSRLHASSELYRGDDVPPRLSGSGADSEHSTKAPPSKIARKQRARKPKSLASCTFTAAALSHAPTTQINAHTGGRVPLTFVDADEDSSPHPISKKGRLVDPRKATAFLDMPSPSTGGVRLGPLAAVRPTRKPVTRWMLRGANVKDATRGQNPSYDRAFASSRTVIDRDQVRCKVFPFALVPLEEHEASLQTKKQQENIPVVECRKLPQQEEGQSGNVPLPAVMAIPVPPRRVHKQPERRGVSAGKSTRERGFNAPPGATVQSTPSSAGKSASEDPRPLPHASGEPSTGAIAMSAELSTSAAASPTLDFPKKTNVCNSLADRPDRAASPAGLSSSPVDCDNSSSLAIASAARVTPASFLNAGLGNTGTVIDPSEAGVSAEKSVRLRPLASYLDSLRETARAATKLQSSTQERSSRLKVGRSARAMGRPPRDGASPAMTRPPKTTDLRSQTTFNRDTRARGFSAPYPRNDRPVSRRAIRPWHPQGQEGMSSPNPFAYNATEGTGSAGGAPVMEMDRPVLPMLLDAEDDVDELAYEEECGPVLSYSVDLFSGYLADARDAV